MATNKYGFIRQPHKGNDLFALPFLIQDVSPDSPNPERRGHQETTTIDKIPIEWSEDNGYINSSNAIVTTGIASTCKYVHDMDVKGYDYILFPIYFPGASGRTSVRTGMINNAGNGFIDAVAPGSTASSASATMWVLFPTLSRTREAKFSATISAQMASHYNYCLGIKTRTRYEDGYIEEP